MTVVSIAGQYEPPDPRQVLGWVSAAAPGLWFLSDCEPADRERARQVVWDLCRAGRVEVGDWVPGRGQGFRVVAGAAPPDSTAAADYDPDAIRRPLLDPRPAVVTPLLLVVHVLWFIGGGLVAAKTRAASDYLAGTNHPIIYPILRQTGAVSAADLLRGEWWRLLTCEFVHVGVFHLFGNMVILALLGTLAEAVWGRWRLLLVYLLAGLAASTTVMAVTPLSGQEEVVYASASGGLWGVTAAVLAWLIRNMHDAPPLALADCSRRVAVVGVMNLVVSFAQGVSLAGLVGGALGGLVVAACLARLGKGRGEGRMALAGLLLAAATFAGALTAAVYTTADWQEVRDRVGAADAKP
jgi:rhomboid protease GluP